ncbi:MAG: hypothetical protein ABI790_12535 [Betaproteobacteria bacterium]
MNTSMKTSKDNMLMTTLLVTGLFMATLGPALARQDTAAVMDSASRMVQSVSTPTALEPIMYREAAIIVTAPRIKAVV